MASRVNVQVSGPLFDRQAARAVVEWMDETKRKVADLGVKELDAVTMDRTGRGTGHYQSMIQTHVLAYNDIRIDDPVVYGPWLEGYSKRNESTRFKGYHLWRRTRLRLRKTFQEVAQKLLDDHYLRRMGGKL